MPMPRNSTRAGRRSRLAVSEAATAAASSSPAARTGSPWPTGPASGGHCALGLQAGRDGVQ